MSEPQRVFVKLFATDDTRVTQDDVIPVFHTFIKEQKLDEVWVDVTSYAHVKHGPGVILIGHHAQYGLDEGEGKLGLLYARKRGATGTAAERFADALTRATRARDELARSAVADKLSLRTNELLIGAQDKLNAPNTDETFETLRAAISTALTQTFGKPYTLTRVGDPRGPFTVLAQTGDTLAAE